MTISRIKPIGKSPLTTIVYQNIKEAIIAGEIKSGSRLTEAKVSQQLEVSSTPVREAFRRLESERLVKIIPYRGAVVQEFSITEVEEVYQCRRALEVLAIELAVENIDDEGIDKLYELLKKSKKEEDFSMYVKINTEIHDSIISYANNVTLVSLIEQLQDVIFYNRNVSSYNESRKQEIYNEHVKIIQALESKDKDLAIKAMSDHVINGFEYIKEEFKKSK